MTSAASDDYVANFLAFSAIKNRDVDSFMEWIDDIDIHAKDFRCEKSFLAIAVAFNSTDIVRILYSRGCRDALALEIACKPSVSFGTFVAVLESVPARTLNEVNDGGYTPLHVLANITSNFTYPPNEALRKLCHAIDMYGSQRLFEDTPRRCTEDWLDWDSSPYSDNLALTAAELAELGQNGDMASVLHTCARWGGLKCAWITGVVSRIGVHIQCPLLCDENEW
jgi:hypothetical protein